MAQTWHFSMVSIPTYPNISQHNISQHIPTIYGNLSGWLYSNRYRLLTISSFPVISSRNFWAAQLPMGSMGNAQRVLRGTSGGNVRIAYPGTVPHGEFVGSWWVEPRKCRENVVGIKSGAEMACNFHRYVSSRNGPILGWINLSDNHWQPTANQRGYLGMEYWNIQDTFPRKARERGNFLMVEFLSWLMWNDVDSQFSFHCKSTENIWKLQRQSKAMILGRSPALSANRMLSISMRVLTMATFCASGLPKIANSVPSSAAAWKTPTGFRSSHPYAAGSAKGTFSWNFSRNLPNLAKHRQLAPCTWSPWNCPLPRHMPSLSLSLERLEKGGKWVPDGLGQQSTIYGDAIPSVSI